MSNDSNQKLRGNLIRNLNSGAQISQKLIDSHEVKYF